MKKILVIIILAIFILIGISFYGFNQNNNSTPNLEEAKEYTFEEIKQYNISENCLMVINNEVYNISSFIALGIHNNKIINGCGKNVTEMFSKHSQSAKDKLESYKIGVIK